MGLGLDEKGGGGGRRVGLILLFQCGGREWGWRWQMKRVELVLAFGCFNIIKNN